MTAIPIARPTSGNAFATVLIAADLVAAAYLPPVAHFVVNCIALTLLASRAGGQATFLRRLMWPSFAIIFIALAATIWNPAPTEDLVKGLWYLSRPIVYLSLGILAMSIIKDPKVFARAVLIATAILAVVYITRFYLDPTLQSVGRVILRRTLGFGSALWPVGLVLIAFFGRELFGRQLVVRASLAVVLVTAMLISDGRSFLVTSVIIMVTMLGLTPRRLLPYVVVPVLLVGLAFLTTPFLYMIGLPVDYTFVGGLPMISESAPIQQATIGGINQHWRGHETFLAYQTVFMHGAGAVMFGLGLGTTVDIGFTFQNGNLTREALPIFHNGYAFLFVRAGLIGLLLYAVQIALLAKAFIPAGRAWRADRWCALGSGIVYSLVLSTFTVAGLYNYQETGASIPILLGALAVYARYGVAIAAVGREASRPIVSRAGFPA